MAVTCQYCQITMLEAATKGEFVVFVVKSILLVFMATKSARKIESLMMTLERMIAIWHVQLPG